MVSEMESVKNVTNNSVNNAPYNMANSSPQPAHSPQSVGIEFVRQYYTMLNRAPSLLFRFYSDDSTFVHGCLDKQANTIQFVRGQKQINAKIMSLNFNNCHTKIRQVDSMETIGNGVVIQVIGELSNNGQPLRRFLQTFVLTPQSPNKYYVRNDIFRYQDDFNSEENDDSMEKNEIETKIETNIEVDPMESIDNNEKDYYQQNGTLNDTISDHVSSVEENLNKQEETDPIQENSMDFSTNIVEETNTKEEQLGNDDTEEAEVESVSDSAINSNHLLSNEPKTYASMLSKSFQGGVSPNLGPAKPAVNVTLTPVNFTTTTTEIAGNVSENPVVQPATGNNKSAGFPQQRERERFPKKPSFNKRNESRESGRNEEEPTDAGDVGDQVNSPKTKIFPDDHQLFIGNLMPNFTEEDLQTIFGPYGKILEIRINRQNHKNPNPNKTNRNYGFITFENADVVDEIIAKKPIYHGNHRYNVEKKQGKSNNYDRNRNNNQNSGSPRNGAQPNAAPNSVRQFVPPVNAPTGQASLGPRPRPGQNYNSANNTGHRNFAGGPNFTNNRNNNNSFSHQQNRTAN